MTQQLPLIAAEIPLLGTHLIEASAGTGKTFNITRIYLRLLLERELTVEQILVMTFTKDATEELRGRIDGFIRHALQHWQTLCREDDFFIAVSKKLSDEKAQFLLKRALLFLDEAAIFTIHGFCNKVLSQHAFTSGLAFNAQMEADSQPLVVEACQDWYRTLALTAAKQFTTVADFWPTPLSFLSSFNKAIRHQAPLDVIEPKLICQQFCALVSQALNDLQQHDDLLCRALIDVKKAAEQVQRKEELAQLCNWLSNVGQDGAKQDDLAQEHDGIIYALTHTMPVAFIDGRRYGRSKLKTELVQAFASVNEVKSKLKHLNENINKAKAYSIVREGIYHVRADIIEKKQQLNLLDFDDLIKTLAQCLTSAAGSNVNGATQNKQSLAKALLEQYPVALVDEFQDTDPQQFAILQAIYYQAPVEDIQQQGGILNLAPALYLIGDPKQAIYGFRGGDVFAYLSARDGCQYQWLMDTNWRSTEQMITGYNLLFNGKLDTPNQVFGYGIPYSPVHCASINLHNASELINLNDRKALQFIHFSVVDENNQPQQKVKQNFRADMAQWCATEISKLLSETASYSPKDIAILVRDGTEAADIKLALEQQNLVSVYLSNRANLFHSQQAKQLLMLLKGICFVENERVFVAALCCGLLGFTPEKLYQLQHDEYQYQRLKFAFISLRDEWGQRGFIAMALKAMHEYFQLVEQDKDRCLTNLLHLFEILQLTSQRYNEPQELLHWFEQQCREDVPETEAELRLESDADLIRIVTQHGAKGLEYPVVFIPFATRHKDPLKFGNKIVSYIEYHDKKGNLCLSLDGAKDAKQAMADEAYAEAIRLLYVAITRAEQRCYLLTTNFDKYHFSPLGRTLKWQECEDVVFSLQQLVAQAPEAIGLEQVEVALGVTPELTHISDDDFHLNKQQSTAVNLEPLLKTQSQIAPRVSQFTSNIERDWWLSSFSALNKNARHRGVSIPDRDGGGTAFFLENTVNNKHNSVTGSKVSIQSENGDLLRFTLTKGAHSGNLLHDILEQVDFIAPDWQQASLIALRNYGDLPSGYDQQDLFSWLQDALSSPLSQGGCLADVTFEQSLRESEFYYPMHDANSSQLASILTEHRKTAWQQEAATSHTHINEANLNTLSNGDINNHYPVNLPTGKRLKGMMHGFIDLVFEFKGKYYLADYKSTYLGNDFSDYQHQYLRHDIEKNNYDLQYFIYSLALHRYLQNTLPNYRVCEHFGGVYYFYLRGMTKDIKHQGAGVYYCKITEQELESLDQLFLGDHAYV